MNLRKLPPVHLLLDSKRFAPLIEHYSRNLVKDAIRVVFDSIRKNPDQFENTHLEDEEYFNQVATLLKKKNQLSLSKLVNATGTILHTNLGRAPLPDCAIQHVIDIASGYSNLEFQLETGKRGHRTDHILSLLAEITGSEAAYIVNNNAGAVLLALAAVATEKEVIVSRGELIEIGGGFRIPDVMRLSGAKLVEIGTTNRTHLFDYQNAINPATGLCFKAHRSNFSIAGFTKEVALDDLITISHKNNVPVMYDVGSGCLVSEHLKAFDYIGVDECLSAGVDIITFSGDKLLGGPQAGLILGKKMYIDMMARHPLARALRIDKMTLAAMEATINLYRDKQIAHQKIPVLKMISENPDDVFKRVQLFAKRINFSNGSHLNLVVKNMKSAIGGGALPGVTIPSWGLEVTSSDLSAEIILTLLRENSPPIIGRIEKEKVYLDFKTVHKDDEDLIYYALENIFKPN